jgi:ABC-type multidrug transport system ATPase subunit
MNKLTVDSVQKSFGKTAILSDVFLHCETGQVLGILGRNGSGKSTLLEIVFGSKNAQNKFVSVNGEIIQSIADNKNNINYLPQFSFIPKQLKLSKIISLFCATEQAQIIAENPKIKPFLNQKPKTLSTGEKRFFEILLVIYSRSKFSLLDEPFVGLSPLLKEKVMELIITETKRKGFIISDHDYATIFKVSTHFKLLLDGGLKDIKNQKDLIDFGYLPVSGNS